MKEESKNKLRETLKNKYENGWIPRKDINILKKLVKISEATKGHKRWEGKTHSNETKKKMSESHKGQLPWNKGKKSSKETLEKMTFSFRKTFF